jgi:uncharacterized protein YjbJ (UPF0337 family)
MSLKDRVKATAKNIEGKAQEVMGNITGDSQTQEQGREKQAEARSLHTIEDAKDKAKELVD